MIGEWKQYDLTWGTRRLWITLYTNKGGHTTIEELEYSSHYNEHDWAGYYDRKQQSRWC